MRRTTRIRHRPEGWQRRRARKLERRQASRALRILEGSNHRRVLSRHEAGERELRRLWDGPSPVLFLGALGRLLGLGVDDLERGSYARSPDNDQTGRGTPVRLRAGVPPVRDREHQARHRRNKAARAARKRNRR